MKSSTTKSGLLLVRFFGITEIFVLFGIQFFWIIYKGDLVYIENSWDLLAFLAPFIVAYVFGAFCRIEKYRVVISKYEWVIHLFVSSCLLFFIILLQLRDEFFSFIPYTWLFYFWIVIIGLIFVAGIARGLDRPTLLSDFENRNKTKIQFGIGAITWLLALGLISLSRYAVYFWIFSLIFHAILVPISFSRQQSTSSDSKSGNSELNVVYPNFNAMIFRKVEPSQLFKKEKLISIFARHFKILFLMFLFFLALNQWAFNFQALGSLEDNYYLVIRIFISPLFYGGITLALLIAKYNITMLGECVGLGLMALGIMEVFFFAPFILGYAVLTIILIAKDLSPTSSASSIIGIQLAWGIGLILFAFNGMLLQTVDQIRFILQIDYSIDSILLHFLLFVLILFVFCIYVGLFVIDKVLNREKKENGSRIKTENHIKSTKSQSVHKSGIILLAIVIGGLISPFMVLSFFTKTPPLIYPEKKRTELEDFCGTALGRFTGDEAEYVRLENLGVRWVRDHFSWRDIEPKNNSYDFSRYDAFMSNIASHNIKVIAMLNYPPSWVDSSTSAYVPPEHIDDYLEYVEATVTHFNDSVDAWEIWNEPNLERFWDGPIEDYYYLFGKAVDLIHEIDPDLYIVQGAYSAASSFWVPPNLEDMFRAGIMEHVDAISIHVYNFDPDTLYQFIKQYIAVGEKYNFTGDYLITELGNPTGGSYPHMVTHKELAENVVKSLTIASTLQIKTFIWYCTRDSGDKYEPEADLRNSERYFGLMYKNYTWKMGAYSFNLFSKYCSTSELRPDLIQISGIAASDLMTALYQKSDGTSTLVMWYSPTLYESGTIRLIIDVTNIQGELLKHDIYDGTNIALDGNVVEIGSIPVILTFKLENNTSQVILQVQESILAIMIYCLIFGTFIASIAYALILYKRKRQ